MTGDDINTPNLLIIADVTEDSSNQNTKLTSSTVRGSVTRLKQNNKLNNICKVDTRTQRSRTGLDDARASIMGGRRPNAAMCAHGGRWRPHNITHNSLINMLVRCC